MGEERRKSVRIKKALTVRYCYGVDKADKKWDMTLIRDISETGMCITTRQRFSLNDILTFLIKVPSRPLEWVEFTGRVAGSEELNVTSREAAAGLYITRVEFMNFKEGHKELIRESIIWFLSKEGGGKK